MQRFKRVVIAIVFLVLPNLIFAQKAVKTYLFASAAGTYTPIVGTNSTAIGDDGYEFGIPIGFNFFYGGIGFTHFGISTNGFIKLGIATTTFSVSNSYLNNLTNAVSGLPYYPCIAGFWDDNHRNNGSISYLTTGAVGSRITTVQWNGINIGNGDTSSTLTASFQIKLFEGTNLVKIIYSNTFSNAGAITASIGLNDQTSFLSVTPGPTPTTSFTTANNSINSLTDIVGKEYTFTPLAPLCSPTNSLLVSGITSSGAVLTANAVSGALGYRFSINTTSVYPTTWTSTTLPTTTLTGLLPNTTYYAQVQVSCSGGNGSAWFTTPFTTLCAVLTPPYIQNFDSVVAPTLPDCMTMQDLNGGAFWKTSTTAADVTPYTSPNCLVYKSDPTIAADDWIYTPPIALTAGTSYRISFYYKNMSSVTPEKLEVKYGAANNATSMTNLIFRDTNILNTSYQVLERNVTPTTTGTYYFGLHDFSNANTVALNIDNLRIEVNPTCGAPTLLNVALNVAATSGVASWTAPTTGAVSGYQYLVSTSNLPPASGTANPTTSVNISGLIPFKQYYLHVRTVCSTNSSWSTLPFFVPYPPCVIEQVPYFENFDYNLNVPDLHHCYTLQDLNGGKTWLSVDENNSSFLARSSPNFLQYTYDTTTANDWFYTPAIHLVAGNSYKISYYRRAGTAGIKEKLEVKYGTGNNVSAMTNLLVVDTSINFTLWTQNTKSFTCTNTGDYYFGFHAISIRYQDYLRIDDIAVDFSTDCGVPTNLAYAINNPTSGVASWTASGTGTVSTYQYAITNSSTPPESGTIVTTSSQVITGLTPGTQYFLHVKSFCVSGLNSAWVTYTFATPCGIFNIPYKQNFDAATIPFLPSCMSFLNVNGGTTWTTDSSAFAYSAPKALVYKAHPTLPGDDWAFTPGMNLVGGFAYELTFRYRTAVITYTDKLEVKYGTSNTVAAMTNPLYSNLYIYTTSYDSVTVRFKPATTGVYYIGFHEISAANQGALYVDDIKVDSSHFCGAPANLSVTLNTNTSGTANWVAPIEGIASTYQYAITDSTSPPAVGTITVNRFAPVTGLQMNKRYFLHVRTKCSDGYYSDWVTYSFVSGCTTYTIPYTENFDSIITPYLGNCMTVQNMNGGYTWETDTLNARSGNKCMTYKNDPNNPAEELAFTPALVLSAGEHYRLSFYYRSQSSFYSERLGVRLGTAPNVNSMNGYLIGLFSFNNTSYQLAQVDFIAPSSGYFYIGFYANSYFGNADFYVDDIKVDLAPFCGLPQNISINLNSDSTGNAKWSPATIRPSSNYEYAISTSAIPPLFGTAIADTVVPIAGLMQSTKYYLHVRSSCAAALFSSWVKDSFYMPCIVRNIPYSENFDGVVVPELPTCITTQDINLGGKWNNGTTDPKSAPNCMIYHYDAAIPANDWFYTVPLNLVGGTNYRLTFYYKARSVSYQEKLEVKYGAGFNNAISMTNLLFVDTNIVSTSYIKAYSYFTPTSSGVYYIGFHAFSDMNKLDLNVDDIAVDFAPICAQPSNLAVNFASGTDATISWNTATADTLTGYEYILALDSIPPASGIFGIGTSFVSNALLQGLRLYAHVRTVCGNGQFSPWATKAFTVPCTYRTIPYSENFDAVIAPALPACMTTQNIHASTIWGTSDFASYSLPNAIGIATDTTNNDNWFYTPSLSLTGGTSYRLSFYARNLGIGDQHKLEVKLGNSNSASSMTNLILVDTNITAEYYRRYQADFVPANSGLFNVGFHNFSNSNQLYFLIDDIKIEQSPNCSDPVNLAIHLTGGNGNAGTATWSPSTPGIPIHYEYVIDLENIDPIVAGTYIPDSTVSFSGLNFFSQYYLHVRTVCTNGISIWKTISFYTLPNDSACNAVALTIGGSPICVNTTVATSAHDPITPCSALPNNTVWFKYTPAVNGIVLLKAQIPFTNYPLFGNVTWFTLAGNCTDSASFSLVPGFVCRGFGQSGVGDIDSLGSPYLTAGVTYYIMVDGYSGGYGEVCLSLLSPPAPPPCVNNLYPTNAGQVDPVSGVNVPFRWRKSVGATGGYDFVLDTINPPSFNAFRVHVSDTTYSYPGINYNRTYYWYVIPKDQYGNGSTCTNNVTSFFTYNPTICTPLTQYGCSYADSISYFSLKGEAGNNIRNNSGISCGDGFQLGYSDYMNLPPAFLSVGNAYSGFVKTGDPNNYVSIWIDFNNNGFFEPTERLLNNLKIGLTKTLYSILIPANAATGYHRLRIRNVYYQTKPVNPTDPCNYYVYGETEDYQVNIVSAATDLRSVANGIPSNCEIVSATTIDAASNNTNALYVPILDSSNNYVAYIYPEGNTLGSVNSKLYVHGGATRFKNGTYYLNRNITIKPEIQPVTPYRLRMYFKSAELDSLIAQAGSGVSTISGLVMTKTKQDSCTSGIANYVATDTSFIPVAGGTYNSDKFVDVSNILSFSTFYLNGHHTYRFIGSGVWSDRNNWENNNVPPSILPKGDMVIIDNAVGGQCILDIPQHISSTGNLIVMSGKKLVIQGNLQ